MDATEFHPLTLMQLWDIWRSQAKKKLLSTIRDARVFLERLVGLIVKTSSKAFPVGLRGVMWFAALPYMMALPFCIKFEMDYYMTFNYFWLMSSGYFHSAILVGLVYAYRNYQYLTTGLKMSAVWFVVVILSRVFNGSNEALFDFEWLLIVYGIAALLITFKDLRGNG